MLTITRCAGQTLLIGEHIKIKVLDVDTKQCCIDVHSGTHRYPMTISLKTGHQLVLSHGIRVYIKRDDHVQKRINLQVEAPDYYEVRQGELTVEEEDVQVSDGS